MYIGERQMDNYFLYVTGKHSIETINYVKRINKSFQIQEEANNGCIDREKED